jgi:uncharacterized membrane protein
MDIRNPKSLRQEAERALGSGFRKWILIHVGITLGVGLALALVDYLLERQIGSTGGLSGVGLRSILTTAQSVLQLVQIVAMPFWQMGWIATALRLARGQDGSKDSLLAGFRKLGPVLRLTLLQGILYFVIVLGSGYAGTMVFMMTPWAGSIMELMTQDFSANPELIYEAMSGAVADTMLPMVLICGGIFLLVAIPVYYRVRLADMCLMDSEDPRALAAMAKSVALTKKNAWNLFRLDLSFWWFYALNVLLTLVAYVDVLLKAFGILPELPAEIGFIGAYLLYAACQLGLYGWRKTQMDAAYVKAYDCLREEKEGNSCA